MPPRKIPKKKKRGGGGGGGGDAAASAAAEHAAAIAASAGQGGAAAAAAKPSSSPPPATASRSRSRSSEAATGSDASAPGIPPVVVGGGGRLGASSPHPTTPQSTASNNLHPSPSNNPAAPSRRRLSHSSGASAGSLSGRQGQFLTSVREFGTSVRSTASSAAGAAAGTVAFSRDGLLSASRSRDDTMRRQHGSQSLRTQIRGRVVDDDGGVRELTVAKRYEGEEEPMDRRARKQLEFDRRMHALWGHKKDSNASNDNNKENKGESGGSAEGGTTKEKYSDEFTEQEDVEHSAANSIANINTPGTTNGEEVKLPPQKHTYYHISSRPARNPTAVTRCLNLLGLQQLERLSLANDRALVKYLQWSFRTSFAGLFASQLFLFFTLVLIFAAFILLAGRAQPACIQGGDYEGRSGYTDAFALSWTTFSTVGYGHTYPSLGAQYSENGLIPGQCAWIGFLSSVESFVGVLYAGFCGAIFFGKVLRIQSKAQVTFSDAVTVRYGDGVECYDDGDEGSICGLAETEESNTNISTSDTEPTTGMGKKVDSVVSLASMASISEGVGGGANASPALFLQRRKKIPCPVLEFRVANNDYASEGGEIIDANLNVLASSRDSVLNLRANRHTLHQETDPKSRRVPKRTLRPVLIEVREHPFFKSVWVARHTLDEDSPLLTPEAKRLVDRNDGYWPYELNDYEGVKASLAFDQILVNLSGVSNLSAASVYEQKVYMKKDVVVGYQFAPCLYAGDDGGVNVDMHLIDDVFEQFGGGGEPLIEEED